MTAAGIQRVYPVPFQVLAYTQGSTNVLPRERLGRFGSVCGRGDRQARRLRG
jgi:hypothetical protein